MGLITTIARVEYGVKIGDQERMLEAVQQGLMGLQRAIEKFDATRGAEFSTYAYFWIKDALGKRSSLKNGIKISSERQMIHHRIRSVIHDLRFRDQRASHTDEEILRAVHASSDAKYVRLITIDHVREFRRQEEMYGAHASLDASVHGNEGLSFESVLSDRSFYGDTRSIEADIVERDQTRFRNDALKEALSELTPRERDIVERLYEITQSSGDIESTYASIGKEMNLSRERIRQIHAIALNKLRQHLGAQGIRSSDVF